MGESADDPAGSDWSVLEGDEYKTSRWDNKAKFFSYKPTHLLLTDIQWDHADVYPTEESYFDAFKKLVKMIPKDGLIVASEKVSSVILSGTKNPLNSNLKGSFVNTQDDKIRTVRYGTQNGDYLYSNVQQTKDSLSFNISHNSNTYNISVPIIGEYMAENICGAFAMACEIGIAPKKIISALQKFTGIKRRLEKRGTINGADVFDDIAHSPLKAKNTLETLRNLYHTVIPVKACPRLRSGTGIQSQINTWIPVFTGMTTKINEDKPKIYAIFEPNTGNRETSAIQNYDHAFDAADLVIIPRLTKLKTKLSFRPASPELQRGEPKQSVMEKSLKDDNTMDGLKLSKIISQTHPNVKYFEDDQELLNFIKQNAKTGDAVVFMGSHSFRGMIDELVK